MLRPPAEIIFMTVSRLVLELTATPQPQAVLNRFLRQGLGLIQILQPLICHLASSLFAIRVNPWRPTKLRPASKHYCDCSEFCEWPPSAVVGQISDTFETINSWAGMTSSYYALALKN
jgi:hypothetical protein